MKEILETIIKNLVEDESQVTITEKEEENTVTFEVKVAESDLGKVIGKQGRIAKSIRTVMKSFEMTQAMMKKMKTEKGMKNMMKSMKGFMPEGLDKM